MIQPNFKLPLHILTEEEINKTDLEKSFYKEESSFDGECRICIVPNDFIGDDNLEVENRPTLPPDITECNTIYPKKARDFVVSDNLSYYNTAINDLKDAEFIIHACNNYHKMIEVLKECKELKFSAKQLLEEINEL